MAERVKLPAYIIFSFMNTIVYMFPAHWILSKYGWLRKLGMIDIAGCCPVHLLGGTTGLISAMMLRPRIGRYDQDGERLTIMANPTNALLGLFMLWWGWLGFNCGSTLGVSNWRWTSAAKSAVSTTNAATGGGISAMIISYIFLERRIDVCYLINGILGSLVSITAYCALAEPWEGFVIGAIGAMSTLAGNKLLNKLKIDDPVGCVGVHGFSAVWGLLAVGIFLHEDISRKHLGITHDHLGIIYGGSGYVLSIQLLGIVAVTSWTIVTSYCFLKIIDLTVGLRVSTADELLGADYVMHGLVSAGTLSLIDRGTQTTAIGAIDERPTPRAIIGGPSSLRKRIRHITESEPPEIGGDFPSAAIMERRSTVAYTAPPRQNINISRSGLPVSASFLRRPSDSSLSLSIAQVCKHFTATTSASPDSKVELGAEIVGANNRAFSDDFKLSVTEEVEEEVEDSTPRNDCDIVNDTDITVADICDHQQTRL